MTSGTAEAARRRPGRTRRLILGLAKWAVAAALVGWLWRSGLLDPSRLSRVAADGRLAGVLMGQVLSMGVPLLRWYLLLRARGVPFSFGQVTQIGLISYFAVILLPATGGQDVVRLYYARRLDRDCGADVLATILLDRFLGLLGLCVLGIATGAVLAARNPSRLVAQLAGASAGLAVVLGGLTLVLVWTRPPWLVRIAGRVGAIAALLASLDAFRTRKAALLTSAMLGVLAQFGNCLSMYFGLSAVGTPVSLLAATAVTPLVTLTTVLPITPLGLGVSDGVAASLFRLVGASGGADATMLSRGATAALCLISGIAYLLPLAGAREDKVG